jgi:hypothetical protein
MAKRISIQMELVSFQITEILDIICDLLYSDITNGNYYKIILGESF